MIAGPSGIVSSIGGGIALGTKQFGVVNTSLSSNSTTAPSGITTEPGPAYIDINFSDDINPSTLAASDLILSGSGLNAANPAHATSFAWIDDHAVRFFLSGGYSNGGTVTASLVAGSIADTVGAALVGYSDSFKVGNPTVTAPVTAAPGNPATPAVNPTTLLANVLPVVQPVAAAPPVSAASVSIQAVAAPSNPTPKLTAKEEKQKQAAAAKAAKAEKAAEAKAAKAAAAAAAKAHKAAAAKAAQQAKAAHKAAKKAK